jgi:hypothetical protein
MCHRVFAEYRPAVAGSGISPASKIAWRSPLTQAWALENRKSESLEKIGEIVIEKGPSALLAWKYRQIL